MKKNLFSIFLLFLAFQGTISASECASCECSMKKVHANQLVVSDEGVFIFDENTNGLSAVEGLVSQGNGTYMVMISKQQHRQSSDFTYCGHSRGCLTRGCKGCYDPTCWNACEHMKR